MKPHKHAELIKAYANGAKIQYWDSLHLEWIDTTYPNWYNHVVYRIKPDDDLCSCSAGDECPTGKTGCAPRCTSDELRAECLRLKKLLGEPVISDEIRNAIKVLFPESKWVAMDEGGATWAYEEIPSLSTHFWIADGQQMLIPTLFQYAPDWKNSLVELCTSYDLGCLPVKQ